MINTKLMDEFKRTVWTEPNSRLHDQGDMDHALDALKYYMHSIIETKIRKENKLNYFFHHHINTYNRLIIWDIQSTKI